VKRMEDVLDAGKNEIIGGGQRHGRLGWEPGQGVADSRCPCLPDLHGVEPIGFECRASVPSVGAMW
jgi:hypothetical protein